MPTNDEVKAMQRTLWGGTADAWAKWHRELEANTQPVNEWLCTNAGLAPGMRVLDLACGAGQPAELAAAKVAPDGRVVATDIAPEMVDAVARLAKSANIANLEAQVMDMEELDYPDESFDAVICRWGFMFAPDTVKAFAASRRVLKPGSRLTTATWDIPARNRWFASEVFQKELDPVSPPPPPDPSAPSPQRFMDPAHLERMVRDAGFDTVTVEIQPFEFQFSSGESWFAMQTELNAPLGARLRRLSDADREAVRQGCIDAIEARKSPDGTIRLAASCLCVMAQK